MRTYNKNKMASTISSILAILLLTGISSISSDTEVNLSVLNNDKCAIKNNWSLVDIETLSVDPLDSHCEVLQASKTSCASFDLDLFPGSIEITVYVKDGKSDSTIEVLVSEGEKATVFYTYNNTNGEFEEGWHTISIPIDREYKASVLLLGYSQGEDIVLINSITFKKNQTTENENIKDTEIIILDLKKERNAKCHNTNQISKTSPIRSEHDINTNYKINNPDEVKETEINSKKDILDLILNNENNGKGETVVEHENSISYQSHLKKSFLASDKSKINKRHKEMNDASITIKNNEIDKNGLVDDNLAQDSESDIDKEQNKDNVSYVKSNLGNNEQYGKSDYNKINTNEDNISKIVSGETSDIVQKDESGKFNNNKDAIIQNNNKQENNNSENENYGTGSDDNKGNGKDSENVGEGVGDGVDVESDTENGNGNKGSGEDGNNGGEDNVNGGVKDGDGGEEETDTDNGDGGEGNGEDNGNEGNGDVGEGNGEDGDNGNGGEGDGDGVEGETDTDNGNGGEGNSEDGDNGNGSEGGGDGVEGETDTDNGNGGEGNGEDGDNGNGGEEDGGGVEGETDTDNGNGGEGNGEDGDGVEGETDTDNGDGGEGNGEDGDNGNGGEGDGDGVEGETDTDNGNGGEGNGEGGDGVEGETDTDNGDGGEGNGEDGEGVEGETDTDNGNGGEENGGDGDNGGEDNGNGDEDNGNGGEEDGDGGEEETDTDNGDGVEDGDNGGGDNGGEEGSDGGDGDGDKEGETAEPVAEEEKSFWNIWTIVLVSVGSVTVVGIVIIGAYYLGKYKGRDNVPEMDLSDLEAPRIIPRAKNSKPPYERFGSEYTNSSFSRD